MHLKKLAIASALAILLIGVPAIASANPVVQETAQALSQQVRKQIELLPWYGVFDNLQYQINGSEVILSGDVTSLHAELKPDAQKAVQSIAGVTKVVNNIHVLPISEFDNQIRRAEFHAIFSKSDLGRYTLGAIPQIHIIVDNGHVTLEGTVINKMDRTVAGLSANTVPNVFGVTNNLRVAS